MLVAIEQPPGDAVLEVRSGRDVHPEAEDLPFHRRNLYANFTARRSARGCALTLDERYAGDAGADVDARDDSSALGDQHGISGQ